MDVILYMELSFFILHQIEAQRISDTNPDCNTQKLDQQICLGNTLNINCDSGFYIDILDSNFGRSTPGICPDTPGTNGNCYTNDETTQIMKERCWGRQTCQVPVSENIFDRQHCVGVSMYLDVIYFCKPNICRETITRMSTTTVTATPSTTRATTTPTTTRATTTQNTLILTTALSTRATAKSPTKTSTTTTSSTRATTTPSTTKLTTTQTSTSKVTETTTTNETTTELNNLGKPPSTFDYVLLGALLTTIIVLVVIAVVLVITCRRLRIANRKRIQRQSVTASYNSSGSGGQTMPKYLSLNDRDIIENSSGSGGQTIPKYIPLNDRNDSHYTIPNDGNTNSVHLSTDTDGYLNPYQPLCANRLTDMASYESIDHPYSYIN